MVAFIGATLISFGQHKYAGRGRRETYEESNAIFFYGPYFFLAMFSRSPGRSPVGEIL